MRFSLTAVMATILLALAGCASSGPTPISDTATKVDLVLRGAASGNWAVECDATTVRGTAHSEMKGHGSASTDVIAMRDIESATCTYSTGDAPLTLTLEDEGLACPFGAYEDGICRTVLAASSTGTIDFAKAAP